MRYICSTKDHGYRDSTNPLRGLNMQRLVALQESGERGEYADLQWFYYYMERSDAMIHSVIQRRRAALLSLDWDVRIVSQEDEKPLVPLGEFPHPAGGGTQVVDEMACSTASPLRVPFS